MPTYATGTDWDNQSSLEVHHTLSLSVQVPQQVKQVGVNTPGDHSSKPPGISCVLFVPEISTVHAGLDDGSIALWALRTTYAGIDCSFLKGHKGPVTCLLPLRKGEGAEGVFSGLIVSGSSDATIKLWDPRLRDRSKACIQTLVGHGGTVTSIVRVGSYVISASTDCTVRAWRAVEGRKAALYPWFELTRTLAKFSGWVHSVSFGTTHKVGDLGSIYCADAAGGVSAFRPKALDYNRQGQGKLDFEAVGQVKRAGGAVAAAVAVGGDPPPPPPVFRKLEGVGISRVLFVADEHLVFTLSYDCKMRTYDTRSGSVVLALENSNGCAFTDILWDSRYRQIILSDRYGYVFVFDVKQDCIVLCKQLVREPVLGMDLRTDTDEVVLCMAASVQFWQIQREREYSMLTGGHHGPVIALAAATGRNPDNDGLEDFRVFSSSLDNTVRIWDPYDMSCVRVLQEDRSEISALAYCESHSTLVTGHDDGTIRLWNLDTGSTTNLRDHTNTVSCITVAEIKGNGAEFVLTGGFDGKVGIWDVRKRHAERPSLVFMFQAHADEVLSILYDPGKGVICTAGNDAVVRVWSASTCDLAGEFSGHEEAITCLTRDAFFLFSGSEDCTVRVWNMALVGSGKGPLKSGAHVKTLAAHTRPVTACLILPDTGHLLTCSLDASLLIWDYSRAEVVKKFQHHEEMKCLAFRVDTNDVLVGTEEHNILTFALPEGMQQRQPGSQQPSDVGTPKGPLGPGAVRFMAAHAEEVGERLAGVHVAGGGGSEGPEGGEGGEGNG